jgi:hypothetical protein
LIKNFTILGKCPPDSTHYGNRLFVPAQGPGGKCDYAGGEFFRKILPEAPSEEN